MTYVYIIGRDDGPVKIGVSHDPPKRLATLQSGCPFRLSLLHQVKARNVDHAYTMEHQCHRLYADHRLVGEWFKIDADTARSAVDICFDTEAHFKARATLEGVSWPA